jgi:hypothetical protein
MFKNMDSKKSKEISIFFKFPYFYFAAQLIQRSPVSTMLFSVMFKLWVWFALNLLKIFFHKRKWDSKSQVKFRVLNWIKWKLDLLEGSMSSVEFWWCYGERCIKHSSIAWNSMHHEHLQFFCKGDLLGTI